MKARSLQTKTSARQPAELELLALTDSEILDLRSGAVVIDRALLTASLLLGMLHAWLGRFSMNPDGISYLDVGDAFAHRNWSAAFNAWWSPAYPWTIGLVRNAIGASPKWDFPVVHLVNFLVFTLSLFAFRFLLRTLLDFLHGRPMESSLSNLPDWVITLLGYAIFLWVSLEVLTIYEVSPDLAVAACVCLSAGALVQLRNRITWRRTVALGFSLALGYWTKTILLPLGLASLAVAYLWMPNRSWRRAIASTALVFVVASAPLIIALSSQKGRFTFGDSGRVNYAWAMSGAQTRNWHGEIPGAGTPKHAPRTISQNPPIFEFDGPVAGTYPPWTDPSYWNEGIRAPFNPHRQLQVLAVTLPSEARLLFRAQPALLAEIVALALLSGSLWISGLRDLWPLISMQLLGMAAYAPIIENDRYLGGFVLLLFVLLIASVKLRTADLRPAIYFSVAIFVAMAFATADYTVRTATRHFAIPGNGPSSTADSEAAAEQLQALGVHPGEKIAVIGDGTDAYWARLDRLKIVAEIMAMNHGAQQFWDSPNEIKQEVYKKLAAAHAELVVSSCPQEPTPDWRRLPGSGLCFRPLK